MSAVCAEPQGDMFISPKLKDIQRKTVNICFWEAGTRKYLVFAWIIAESQLSKMLFSFSQPLVWSENLFCDGLMVWLKCLCIDKRSERIDWLAWPRSLAASWCIRGSLFYCSVFVLRRLFGSSSGGCCSQCFCDLCHVAGSEPVGGLRRGSAVVECDPSRPH